MDGLGDDLSAGLLKKPRADVAWRRSFLPGIQDGFEHGLVEEAVAHPLWDDDVDLLDAVRKRDFFDFALDQLDLVLEVVRLQDEEETR